MSIEATEAIRAYFTDRNDAKRHMERDEPLFASESTNVPAEIGRRTPIMKKSLEAMVKRAARKADVKRWLDVRPHCLRKAFEFALRNAGLDPKDQEFLMGHILPGSQDAYYDRTKVDYLRGKYSQVVFFPERVYTDKDIRKRQILDTVKLLGHSEDKIKKVENALAKYEKADEAMEEIRKLSLDSHGRDNKRNDSEVHSGSSHSQRNSYRIAKGEGKLINSLNNGWDLVKELPEDKFILKRDNEGV